MADNNVLTIERIFDAPVERVWAAWTDPEQIKKWWGPKDFTAPAIKLDLRVGGTYHFCMRGAIEPGGEPQDLWSTGTFREIVPGKKLVLTDSFSNEQGEILAPTAFGMSPDFPKESVVTITFEDQGGKTKLNLSYEPVNDVVFDAMKQSGMEEGWSTSLDKLAESLKA